MRDPNFSLDRLKPVMDFSNYPPNHPWYNKKTQNVTGLFKDEFAGQKKCMEFVGLRSKSYSFLFDDSTEKKTCKGCPKNVIKKHLSFENYKNCLFNKKTYRHQFTTINSIKQKVKSQVKQKISLSMFDSKQHLLNCGIHSVPYGSFKLSFQCSSCLM